MLTRIQIEIAAAVLVAISAAVALNRYNAYERELGAAQVRSEQTQRALAAEQAARAEADRRIQAVQEKANHADEQASAARADAATARTAADRLRQRLADADRRAPAGHPAVAGASAAAAGAGDLRDDVLSRVLDAAGQLGAYADQLHISLDACVGSYQALTQP